MKKRNCRRTAEEKTQHDIAIGVRKMTDAQICELVAKTQEPPPAAPSSVTVPEFIDRLDKATGTGNGIGKSTVYKLRKFAEAEGLMD